MRMLMNNLDPAVAERPEDLVVYGGTGKAARNWDAYHVIVRELQELENNETLLVQSGKAVGKFRTFEHAPRVLIANSNLVPKWGTWDEFRRLEQLGLTMYGQMTAGSWIYIGTQGIVQGTYETFVAAGKQHFGASNHHANDSRVNWKGKWILSAGLGGMGGAQPLAATMAGASFLGIEVDASRAQKRIDTGYCDKLTHTLDEALLWLEESKRAVSPFSIALIANAAEIYPELVKRGVIPDFVTEQTSAHDPLNGYIPSGYTLEAAATFRNENPDAYVQASKHSMARTVEAMLQMKEQGAHACDYGNNIRAYAHEAGIKQAFDIPGFVPAYIRPLFCEGKGPFRWVALSGNEEDIKITDALVRELMPNDAALHTWLDHASQKIHFQGLPARICWLGYGDRHRVGLAFNKLVRDGKVGPIVIGRDHLDCGSVASPNRETESMKDGSDAIADWAILNALVNTAAGADWVSFHHGGGVGMGYSLHAGMVVVADGSKNADEKLERVLQSDPGMGVLRHADAGYDIAQATSKKAGLHVPHQG